MSPIGLAQEPGLEMVKILNRDSAVVRVGERLSFTIMLTNHASFAITNVTVVDDYNTGVLAFAAASPPVDGHDTTAGRLVWDNVASPSLAVGQMVSLTVVFTAEHPATTVVNYARAQDIRGGGSAISNTDATEELDQAIGGRTPVVKAMLPVNHSLRTGELVTFTHYISNDGAALLTYLPLTDTYNPRYLDFQSATPNVTALTPGLLVWRDLTAYFGPLAPFQTVAITTVFAALTNTVATENRAAVAGARDIYQNDLTAGEALVPITIIDENQTPAPTATAQSRRDTGDSSATATPAPVIVTPTPIAESQSLTGSMVVTFPRYLPETGYRPWPFLRPAANGLITYTVHLPLVIAPEACLASAEEIAMAARLTTDSGQARSTLTCHLTLAQLARDKAADMAWRGYFNSVNPEGIGPNQLAREAGYSLPLSYSVAADGNDIEVIAAGFEAITDTWSLLLASGHITQLLGLTEPYLSQREFGVGYTYVATSPFQYYWVFVVAEPAE
jgi:uncharacterized repeat protein (TIGR01451 family)